MTKAELREKLLGGAVMDDLFAFRNGQDCEIFKATRFERSDDIIYIPDLALNLIPAIETGRCPKEQCPAFEQPARFKCAGTVAKAAADLIEEQAAALKRLTDKEEKSCGISDV